MHIQKQNIFAFLLAFILGLSICSTAFAVEVDDPAASFPSSSEVVEVPVDDPSTPDLMPQEEETSASSEVIEEPVEDIPVTEPELEETLSVPDDEEEQDIIYGSEEDIPADAEIVGVEVYSLSPVTPEDTTGLKSVLLQYIGDYDPIIVEYEYQNANNQYTSYLREVQPDYVWLCACGLLVVVLYSLMKLGGALLCRK